MLIPHVVLGISDEATDAEIRSRHLALVEKYPPETAAARIWVRQLPRSHH